MLPAYMKKAIHIKDYTIASGNFGHNRRRETQVSDYFVIRKFNSFWMNTIDSMRLFKIFPYDTICVWLRMIKYGIKAAVEGRG